MKKINQLLLFILLLSPVNILSMPVSDEFSGSSVNINIWTIQKPDSGSVISAFNNKVLIQSDTYNDLYSPNNLFAPRITQTINMSDNWMIEIKLDISLSYTYQEAGMFLYAPSDSGSSSGGYVRVIGRRFDWNASNYVYGGGVQQAYSSPTVYLKYRKVDNTYDAWYSSNGLSWNVLLNNYTTSKIYSAVGLFAVRWDDSNPITDREGNSDNNAVTSAYFDYFRVTPLYASVPVPEPLSMIMLGLSLIALFKRKR